MNDSYITCPWIECEPVKERDQVVTYKKRFSTNKEIKKATLTITACGVFYAAINDKRVSMPMSPGFDCYPDRLPFLVYDVTDKIRSENTISVSVARGWYGWYDWHEKIKDNVINRRLKAELELKFADGQKTLITTDDTWEVFNSRCLKSDIYNGEEYDANVEEEKIGYAKVVKEDINAPLIPFDGENILEHERLSPIRTIITPKGEFVLDFGQNLTGYVEINVTAKKGEIIEISHAETLDKDGNFYTDNYREAKAKLIYVCKDGEQTYKPMHTFFGFQYIRLDKKPENVSAENFTAIVVHSDIKRTGHFECSNPLLNKFFNNVIWGQKDNFLDVPTDCPQRDERLGWTGDARAFCKAAVHNFDCEKFFTRWLKMVKNEQRVYGIVPTIVPNSSGKGGLSTGWAEAAVFCPWEVYKTYGNKQILIDQFDSMVTHVESVLNYTQNPNLWIGRWHYGDWLGLDAPEGSYVGSSNRDLIASAFFARSVEIVVKAGEIIGKDVSKYAEWYKNIRKEFIKTFNDLKTQTECSLVLCFNLTDEKEKVSAKLVEIIKNCGNHLQTGFIGTPYLLHALSKNGYSEVAYSLLLREEFPSWLYSVNCGATTVWEHWDSRNEKGEFWSPDMNSFNHYAYGAAVDWLYGVAAGITPKKAGFEEITIAPTVTKQLDYLCLSLKTRRGEVSVKWEHVEGGVKYTIKTPTLTELIINGETISLKQGEYVLLK